MIGLSGSAADQATAAVGGPRTTELPVDASDAVIGTFGPDGGLWVEDVARASTTLVEVNAKTGAMRSRTRFAGEPIGSPIVGPDGAIWFTGIAHSDRALVIGSVSSAGHLRTFRLPLDPGSDFNGVAGGPNFSGFTAGPDGAMWFTGNDNAGNALVGRITTDGHIKLFRPRGIAYFQGPLIALPDGYLWTTAASTEHLSLAVARIDTSGRVRADHWGFRVAASAGPDLWAWNRDPAGVTRFPATGRPKAYSLAWRMADPSAAPNFGALALGADGKLWFAGAEAPVTEEVHQNEVDEHPVLGEMASDGTVTTWPSSFVNDDEQGPDTTLLPGPDGRLYSDGVAAEPPNYVSSTPEPGHFYAITLPDHPVVHPAAVAIRGARDAAGKAEIGLRCTGQPGRYCSGYITLRSGGRVLASQRYALLPGTIATHTLATAKLTRRTRMSVEVSTHDPIARTVKTVHRSFAAR